MLNKTVTWGLGAIAAAYAVVALAVGADRGAVDISALAGVLPAALAPNARMAQVRDAIVRRDAPTAVKLAGASILDAPLDARRLSAYGVALGLTGNAAKGYDAFLLAGQMGWRDPATQIFWMQAALNLGDAPVAAMRLDGLLRTRPQMADQAELTSAFDTDANFGDALIARMQAKPEWISAYVGSTRLLEGDRLNSRVALLERMAGTGLKVGCEQIAQVVDPLTRRGMFDAAFGLWRSHCDDRPAGLIMDGEFAAYNPAYEEMLPFRWRVPASGDLNVSEEPQKSGGKLLEMRNVSPTPMVAASQLAMIGGGQYRLTWLARDTTGRASVSMVPRLWCADAKQVDAQDRTLLPDGRWQATFKVSDQSCSAWSLQFTLQPTSYPVTFGSVTMARDGVGR